MVVAKMLARRLILATAVVAAASGVSLAAYRAAGMATYAAGSFVGR